MATGVRRQQAERTEAELKAAAVRVFGRLGYLNTKITDITAEAGRAAGSFYSHFGNKEALLEALLADVLAFGDASAGSAGHSDDFSSREAVRFHVASYWHASRRHRVVLDALRQAATVDAAVAARLQELTDPDLRHMAEHLVRAREGGLTLPGDPARLAEIFTTLMAEMAAQWQAAGMPDDEAIELLTSFYYAGIGG